MSDIRQSEFNFMDEVLSVKEAALILGITDRQATRLIESGELVGKLLGRQYAVSRASVLALAKIRAAAPQPIRKRTGRNPAK